MSITGNIVPRADGEGTLGVPSKHWGNVFTKKVNGSEIKETPEIGAIPKAGADGKLDDAWIGGAKAPATHTHDAAGIDGLTALLALKAETTHTHTIANVTGLQTALDGKSATSHTHSYLPLTGGTLTGVLTAQNNTSYTTKQARNITLSTAAASGGGNGDVWIQY